MEVIPEALQKIAPLTGRRKLIFRLAPGNCLYAQYGIRNILNKKSKFVREKTSVKLSKPVKGKTFLNSAGVKLFVALELVFVFGC